MFTPSFHSEVLGTLRTIFVALQSGGTFMSFAMKNPCRLSIFGSELKPEAVEGAIFNTDNLDFFILMN